MTALFINNDLQYSRNVVCVPGMVMNILLLISHLLLTIIPKDDDGDGSGGSDGVGDGNSHFIEKESEAPLCSI